MSEELSMRVRILDAGKPRTPDEQMRAIRGISIDDFVRELKRNDGGKYDKIFIRKK